MSCDRHQATSFSTRSKTMGKKRHKEHDAAAATTTPRPNEPVSSPSDIFKTLFIGPDHAPASSLFSDNNPFKRKPEDPKSNENPSSNSHTQNPNFDELKQRKRRTKEEKPSHDAQGSTSEEESAERPKKVKSQNPNLGIGKREENEFNDSRKKRKKRKRDDLERDYETRKYGAIAPSEENVDVVVGTKRKKADDAVDALVSKESEGFDDENKLLRTVFVGNLPLKVKKKALVKEFSRFGEVESLRIRSVPIADTKIPRKGAIMLKQFNDNADSVHAYIVFKTEDSAEASLAHNMAVVGGNHIRVDRAYPPRKKLKSSDAPLYDTKRTIFVGNLPFDVKDEEIYKLFSGIKDLASSIEAVRVIRDPHLGVGKGIAYVLFKTREAANLVIRKRNLKLRDRELRLSHARQDSTPSKRRNSFYGETANSPRKKLAADSRTPNQPGTKAIKSYQGLRATKSGGEKKVHAPLQSTPYGEAKKKSKAQQGEKRQVKRPAVALRKARATAPKDSGASVQGKKKRKLESRTPDSSNRKKKARKFR